MHEERKITDYANNNQQNNRRTDARLPASLILHKAKEGLAKLKRSEPKAFETEVYVEVLSSYGHYDDKTNNNALLRRLLPEGYEL